MSGSMQILPLEAPPVNWSHGPLPPSQLTELQAVATHTLPIGIIHPPTDIRNIVETTAQHVSKNGITFENKVKAQKAKDAKFAFLNSSDPYHAFYQHKIAEYRMRNQDVGQDPKLDAQVDIQAQFRAPPKKPLEPFECDDKYTVRVLEGVTCEELDIIKLTSQFVARNGKTFLNGLQSREITNPQFHFMKPTHSLFPLFTSLVDAYFDVLKPSRDMKEKMRKRCADLTTVLERCLHRLEWQRYQEKERKKDEDEKELERVQMAMIDWHDFTVVEEIEFGEDEYEELPMPMTLEEVIKRSKVSAMEPDEIVEPAMEAEMEMEMDEEENNLVAEGLRAANEDAPMRVVKNWKRPEDRMISTERNPTKVVISPITGELVPINEMSEHMRISLIDPKFKEQKDRMFAKIRDTTLAQDDEIAKNIVGLARLRPDIFGTTEEEVSNAVKAEINKKKYDQLNQAFTQNTIREDHGNGAYGHPISFPGPSALPLPHVPTVQPLPPPHNFPRPPAPPRQLGVPMMQPMHQQDQILMPCPPGHLSMRPPQMEPAMPMPPPPGPHFAHFQVPRPLVMMQPPPHSLMSPALPPTPLPEEPELKRQKFDESVLVPEDQFLLQHPGSATIRVSVPNVDDGKVIEVTMQSLSENVGSLKEKIAGEINIQANKQKLSGKAGLLKDNMSLAHYNLGAGEILTLSLRERGGRKR